MKNAVMYGLILSLAVIIVPELSGATLPEVTIKRITRDPLWVSEQINITYAGNITKKGVLAFTLTNGTFFLDKATGDLQWKIKSSFGDYASSDAQGNVVLTIRETSKHSPASGPPGFVVRYYNGETGKLLLNRTKTLATLAVAGTNKHCYTLIQHSNLYWAEFGSTLRLKCFDFIKKEINWTIELDPIPMKIS